MELFYTGKTVEEATAKALEQLGIERDEISIEVVEMPVRKLFRSTPAKIRVTLLAEEAENERKAAEAGVNVNTANTPESISEKECGIIRMLNEFPAVIRQAGTDYSPSGIANYTYELAKEYNQFYHDFSILREENESIKAFRILLTRNVGKVIKTAMNILGIDVPERM